MKRELKYIFRRILIGFGILCLFSMVNSCNVKAYENTTNYRKVSKTDLLNNSDIKKMVEHNYISFYKNTLNNSVYFCASYSNNCYEMYFPVGTFTYKNIGLLINSSSSSTSDTFANSCVYLSSGVLPKITENGPMYMALYNSDTYSFCVYSRNSDKKFNISGTTFMSANENTYSWINSNILNVEKYSNTNWNYYNNYYVSSDNIFNEVPTIDSLQPTVITSSNDYGEVITGYIIRPKFSYFNTNEFNYYYRFNDSPRLSITENEQIFRVNANGTVYVDIEDKNGHNIASSTFTITRVGDYLSIKDNSINWTYIMSTNDNSDSQNKVYTSEAVSIEFLLWDTDKFTYETMFVPDGQTANVEDFEEIDSNFYTKNYHENGVIYARMISKYNNQEIYSDSFSITELGKESSFLNATLNNGSDNALFNKLNKIINYGGPISNIINLPNQFYVKILTSSTLQCKPISLGSYKGHNLSLPCINLESYFGSTWWNRFDLLLSGILILNLVFYFISLYHSLINIEYTPQHMYKPKRSEGGDMV